MPKHDKRRVLRNLAGISGVTSTALAEVLQTVQSLPQGTDLDVSRKTIDRVYGDISRKLRLHYEILHLKPGPIFHQKVFHWHTCSVQNMFRHFCNDSPNFRRVMECVYNTHGNRWRLILYCDGITPGALLRPDVKKKLNVYYFSFLELGPLLARKEFWLPVAAIRDSVTKQVHGGLSVITRLLLRQTFLGVEGVQTNGMETPMGKIYISLHSFIADEDALNAAWGIKGASGYLPCAVQCCVVMKPRANRPSLSEQNANIRDICCANLDEITQLTNGDVWAKVQDLESDRYSPARKKSRVETALGMNDIPEGLLQDRELRAFVKPTSVNTFDVMHILYSNGLVGSTLLMFLHKTHETYRLYYKHVEAFLKQPWHWTRQGSNAKIHEVFNRNRENVSSDAVRAGASELLTVYPAIRHWIESHPDLSKGTGLQKEKRALLKLFAVCDLVEEARRTFGKDMRPIAERLKDAVKVYMTDFIAAYGKSVVKPKHHMLLHVPAQLNRDLMLLSCWPLERKHQTVLSAMNHKDNTCDYERTFQGRVVASQIHQLANFKGDTYLHDPIHSEQEGSFWSNQMHYKNVVLNKDECCFIGEECWQIHRCIKEQGCYGIFGKQLRIEKEMSAHAAMWSIPSEGSMRYLEDDLRGIRNARLWRIHGSARVEIIR